MKKELKLGHSVIAWDEDKSEAVKGMYVRYEDGATYPYSIFDEEEGALMDYENCILDPEATEFLSGDEVYVRTLRKKAFYVGANPMNKTFSHVVLHKGDLIRVPECRYPAPEQPEQDEIDRIKALYDESESIRTRLYQILDEVTTLLKKFVKSE